MLREFRLVALMLVNGSTEEEVVEAAVEENAFQYPTTTEAARVARTMLLRLNALNDDALVTMAARAPKEAAAQINLYAMMRVYPLMAAFMNEVIAPKYRYLDYSITRAEVNSFIASYQVSHPEAATWSDSTISRIVGVVNEALVEAGYLASRGSEELLPFMMDDCLVDTIYRNGDEAWLPSFNYQEVI